MKAASWELAVFSRREGRHVFWRTVGLGRFDVELAVRSAVSGPLELQRALARKLGRASALELAGCRPASGGELRRVHLDLRFQQPHPFHLSGPAPLVVEPVGPGEAAIAYSPLRPADFFVVDPAADLARQANRFFADAWQGLEDEEGEALLSRPHDRLLVVPVRIGWPALGEQDAGERQEKAGAGRRRRERVLELVATPTSAELAAADPRLESLPEHASRLERRLLDLLAAEKPPSLALIGPPGCGKSHLVKHLAGRLLIRDGFLEHGQMEGGFQVFRLSGRRLIAGMSNAGDWEQRCLDLLEECRQRRLVGRRSSLAARGRAAGRPRGERAPPIVLWVDDLGAWGQIGQSRQSRRSLADVFLAPLRRSEILIFGETTPEGFSLLEEDAPAFAALFKRVDLARPGSGQVLSILLEASRRLEDRGAAPLAPAALRALIETTPAIYGEEAHPGASCRLLGQAAEELPAGGGAAIDASRILDLMARESGLPRDLLRSSAPLEIEELKAHFARRVLGQDEAVQAVADVVTTLKAGLGDPRRPHAVLLFTGPSGIGKTELAKTLAAWLYGDERRLLRFDMGEHGDSGALARLVGDRERPEGLLTEAVRAQPFCVLLFDEVEKADIDVLNLLLQVFEDGRLTDALGQVADFRQAVLILTSNLGANPNAKVGLRKDAEAAVIEAREAVERFFAPELWNRIDRVVAFRALEPSVGRRIAELELARIFTRRGLTERGVFVRLEPRVMDRIQQLAFDARSGARGVKRFLENEIVMALAQALAAADPAAFMLFSLSAPDGGGFRVEVESLREAAPLPANEAIDRLFELPPARLLAEIPDWLGRLAAVAREHGAELEREESERLRSWRRLEDGGPARQREADALHEIDGLRTRVEALAARLGGELERRRPDEGELREAALLARARGVGGADQWGREKRHGRLLDPRLIGGGPRPIAGEEMVELASEILWLEYAAARRAASAGRAGELFSGLALVELDLLSEQRPLIRARQAPEARSLQQELAELLLDDAVGLEGFLAEEPAGTSESCDLAACLALRPQRLWLVLSGNLLAERLRADVGCYVRVRGDGNQEIVRLVTHPLLAGAKGPPAELVARRAELAAPAESPGRELTLLQLIHFEPPPAGEWSHCRIEDYGLSLEVERPVRRLREALVPLRRRRQLAYLAAPAAASGGAEPPPPAGDGA